MYKLFTFLIFINSLTFCGEAVSAQDDAEEKRVMAMLDSVSNSAGISSYFASIYLTTLQNAVDFFERSGDSARGNIRIMELSFTRLFFLSAEAFEHSGEVPDSWKAYYADTSASRIRHLLLGINAHINGDIWKALTACFSPEEIRQLKPLYRSYYPELQKIYESLYNDVLAESRFLQRLHLLDFGLEKWYGRQVLRRWLNRQFRLAEWYYSRPRKFSKRRKILERKSGRINQLISRHFR